MPICEIPLLFNKLSTMVAVFFLQLLLVSFFFSSQISLAVHHARSTTPESPSKISVAGVVYCDICARNSFSRSSYLLPGVDVHIECKFKAKTSKTNRQTSISINKTTDKYGVYELEIPSFEGEDCEVHQRHSLGSFCKARLLGNNFSSPTACNVLGSKTSAEVFIKSKHGNHCLYNLEALNYAPSKINISLCGDKREFSNSFNVSKTFFPFFPPYVFPWRPFPTFPFPPLPPLPQFPFPPLPHFPTFPFPTFPFPLPPPPPRPQPPLSRPPSLPFPFPPLPPYPPPPPPLAFDPRDPRTWTPYLPFFSPPPPAPPFDPRDPRTWTPYLPFFSPPPPGPPFDPRDPRNWIPNVPFLSPPPFPPGLDPRDPRTWIPKVPSPLFPPPTFDPRDPRTWPPSIPSFTPPPPIVPSFDPRDPRNWIPRFPSLAPPPLPPLGFDPRDPRTWIPYYPPAPPPNPEYSKP